MGVSGNVLPWDQNGYEAIKVEANIVNKWPVAGPWLAKMALGGPEPGNLTLTRLYALHVAILPLIVITLGSAHLALARRHRFTGSCAANEAVATGFQPVGTGKLKTCRHNIPTAISNVEASQPAIAAPNDKAYWPGQACRDVVVSMVLFAGLVGLVLWGFAPKLDGDRNKDLYKRIALAGRDGYGAALSQPADPSAKGYPARPEWYLLWLYHLRGYFAATWENIATALVPAVLSVLLLMMPLLGHGPCAPFWLRGRSDHCACVPGGGKLR